MAPRDSRKDQRQEFESGSESEEENSSPGQDALNVMMQASKLVESSNARREKKRKAIEAEHEKRVKDVKMKMDSLFSNRKNKVTKSQQDLWTRLAALNQKRQSIEAQILHSMKNVEQSSISLSGELVRLFHVRLREMEVEVSPAPEE